jgi:uncharacterized protein YaiE (UPF0345 family)
MRLMALFAGLGAVIAAGAAQAETPTVEIRDAVARVTVIPEARSDIKVEFLSHHPNLPLEVRTTGSHVVVDGDLDRKIRNCQAAGGRTSVNVAGVGEVRYDDIPQVVIRTPKDVNIEAGGAVFGAVGKSASLGLSNAGCGDWTIANVDRLLKLNQAGSGDSQVGSAGEARLRVAGSGDIRMQAVRGALHIDVAGSGDVWAASVNGPLDVKIAGSGDVTVADGRAPAMTVSVAGSGGVDFGGVAGSLKARIAGSGDVRAKAVTGEVSKAVVGSGEVKVG